MSMQTITRYCENCAFYEAHSQSVSFDYCKRPRDFSARLLVRRSETSEPRYCEIERGHDTKDTCGPTGKFFTPSLASAVGETERTEA